MNLIYALLARPWGGLVVAGIVAILAWCFVRGALRREHPVRRALAESVDPQEALN